MMKGGLEFPGLNCAEKHFEIYTEYGIILKIM